MEPITTTIANAIASGNVEFSAAQWKKISHRKEALPLLLVHINRVDWAYVSQRRWAIPLWNASPSNIVWDRVGDTTWAATFIKNNVERVDWNAISRYQIVLRLTPECDIALSDSATPYS